MLSQQLCKLNQPRLTNQLRKKRETDSDYNWEAHWKSGNVAMTITGQTETGTNVIKKVPNNEYIVSMPKLVAQFQRGSLRTEYIGLGLPLVKLVGLLMMTSGKQISWWIQ